MNRFLHLLLLALLGLITACSYNELPENLSPLTIENDGLVLQVETRAETYKGQSLDQEYFVTAADLENFVKYRRSASKRSDLTVKEVKSYGFDSSQTLFYILNYDQGWEVISADKRIQPTLAHGDSGEFTMECDNEAMKFWMNMIADGVLQMRLGNVESEVATASAESKESTDDPKSDHTAFWNAISPTKNGQTRFEPLTPTPGPMIPLTYTYLIDSEITAVNEYEYGPYIQTSWAQRSPWNQFCPLYADGTGYRAPAGCTAIAGAQMMYYFYHTLGWQLMVPTRVAVSGDTDQHSYAFGSYNYRMFDSMAKIAYGYLSGTDPEHSAKLISYVGHLSGMDYEPDGSGAFPMTLAQQWQSLYNIDFEYFNGYDYLEIVYNFLDNNQPLIIWGSEDSDEGGGHTWIIDGLNRTVESVTNYYVTFSTPQTPAYLSTLDKEDATSSSTTSNIYNEVHMNWGWGSTSEGVYYSMMPSDWLSYEYVVQIIYNFSRN